MSLVAPWPGHWLLIVTLLVLGGPWAGVVFYVARDLPKFWRHVARRLEFRARTWEVPPPRAVWVVRLGLGWRFRLLKATGLLWLPKSVPLLGGDLFLLDIQERSTGRRRLLAAAGLANPRTKRGRRMGRLALVEAFWWLEQELPVAELPHLSRSRVDEPIVALDPPDEEQALWRGRLLAKSAWSDPRRPTWRHERAARELFHQLWGMHGMGAAYQKPVWNQLQDELNRAGVRV